MLNLAVRNTKKLIRERSREDNVRLGRFFTKKQTAALMGGMFTPTEKAHLRILDPGAGTGILSAALLEAIASHGGCQTVALVCYETDATFLPMLENNLERLRKKCRHDYGIKVKYEIRNENFVTAAVDEPYDMIIANPPSELLHADRAEIAAYREVCAGATDLAFLFAVAAARALAEGGQLVALLPSAYANSAYLEKIRRHLATLGHLERLHLFVAPSKNGAHADSIRKTLVLKFTRSPLAEDATILVSSSPSETSEDITLLPPFPYGRIVNEENGSLLLLKSEEDAALLTLVESLPERLSTLGLRMRTGLTLESRYRDQLREEPTEGAVPLIRPSSMRNGMVWQKDGVFVIPVIPSLAQKNKNMLFIKRVPAKSDARRMVCAVYLASQFARYPRISTHNKLNYIDYADGREMDSPMLHGLYAVLTSDLYESYLALISHSSRINAKDYEELPLPTADVLRKIGNKLLMTRQFTPKMCSVIVKQELKLS